MVVTSGGAVEAALDPDKHAAAEQAGRVAMDLVRKDIRPSEILTRQAIDNAIASIAATGGSTNGVLHLLAIARELGIPLSIDEFDTILERTPVIADMKPWGTYVATDLYEAGGLGLVGRELLRRELDVEVGHPACVMGRGYDRTWVLYGTMEQ